MMVRFMLHFFIALAMSPFEDVLKRAVIGYVLESVYVFLTSV